MYLGLRTQITGCAILDVIICAFILTIGKSLSLAAADVLLLLSVGEAVFMFYINKSHHYVH